MRDLARFFELWKLEDALPMSSDMIDVFFYLSFELFDRAKGAIVADDVHDVDMNNFPIYITIKTYDMDFKMSFFALI